MSELELSATYIPALHKPSALLPIARHRNTVLFLVETFPVTIVIGQTGSGKTTQIPQFLDQAGWCADGKVIAVTQVGKLDRDHLGRDFAIDVLRSLDGWRPPLSLQELRLRWNARSAHKSGIQSGSKT